MSVLLDTNILVDLLNGHSPARDFLKSLTKLNVSSITAYEVLAGCSGPRAAQLPVAEVLLSHCEVIPVSAKIAARAAEFQRRRGSKRKMADFLIEATAMEFDLELATRNPKDFEAARVTVPYQL